MDTPSRIRKANAVAPTPVSGPPAPKEFAVEEATITKSTASHSEKAKMSEADVRQSATLDATIAASADSFGQGPPAAVANKGRRFSQAQSRSSSTQSEYRFAREVSETFSMKLRDMKRCWIALIGNILMLFATRTMEAGTVISVPKDIVETWEAVVLEILLLVTNIFTILAMDAGLAAFFGHQIATRGRSMAAIGFVQAHAAKKWSFANDLSLNSTVRKIMNRLAIMWAIAEFLKLITPLGASALRVKDVRSDAYTVDCIQFHQATRPVDRNWPNLNAEIGFAELIFGKSIGRLRSQEEVDETLAIVGPQLIGVVYDGDTIVGKGFTLNITSQCYCSEDDTAASLKDAGIPDAQSATFSAASRSVKSRNIFIANYVENNEASTELNVYSALFNTPLCGGLNTTGTPVCQTRFHGHKVATVQVEYMTDGTTASIAQKFVEIRDYVDNASLNNWAYFALQAILGKGVQTDPLPSQVPGMISPILWWTTVDLMAIDPAMLEAGMETFFTILFRAGIQRTYGTEGAKCVRNIVDTNNSYIKMAEYGVSSSLAAIIIQLIFNIAAILAYIPWLVTSVPLAPAIRAMRESIYFTTLLADSNLGDNLKGLCNAPTHAIWQSLDIVVRIGESIMTQDEEVGHITMDKPKVVRPLVNARRYN